GLRGHRAFRLPSRRRQGADRARGGVRPRRRAPRRGPLGAARFRQHVGGDRAVRAGAHAAGGRARQDADDRARSRLHRRLPAAGARVNPWALGAVLLVALLRLLELAQARRNTRALLAQGGRELGRGHYPLILLLHSAWLAAIAVLTPADAMPSWPLLALFAALQGLRLWVLASLGRFWTTRVIDLPGVPLVRRGPYRFMRHPNYLVVAAE